jgi:hypothetical protein
MAWVRRSFSSRAENARQSSRLFSMGRAADSQRSVAGSGNDLPCVTIWLSLHRTRGRCSHSPNTVRRSDCFCTPDARFGVAAVVWNASTAHYPLLHRHCVFGGGHGRFRQVVASRHCGRRPEGIAAKQPHPHLWRWPIFRRLYRGRYGREGGRPPHRRLHAQPGRSKKVRPSAGEGGRPQVRR